MFDDNLTDGLHQQTAEITIINNQSTINYTYGVWQKKYTYSCKVFFAIFFLLVSGVECMGHGQESSTGHPKT